MRTGEVSLHHLGVVLVVQRDGVALCIGCTERIRPLCSRVGQVDLRQAGERYFFAVRSYLNTLGDIFERREQGGELACRRVRGDGNIARQFIDAGRSMATDRRGVGSEEAVRSSIFGHLGLLAVEGEVGTVQTKGDGRHADIVLRQPEADRQGVIDRTAADTTYEIDKRRVEEVVLHFIGEIIGAGKGVPAAGYHGVSVQTCLDVVLADRYADGVFPLRVGLFHLAVGSHQLAVNIETDTLGRDVRAGVIDMSPHGEGAHVLKVDIVRREGRWADEHRARGGIEPVDAQLRRDLVVGTALLEGDAADDIVAVAVGQTVQTEALRNVGSGGHVRTYLGVVELIDTVLAGYIEGVFHYAQSFV